MATDATGTPTTPDNIARIAPVDSPSMATLTTSGNAIADSVQTALTNNYLRATSIVNAHINAAAAIAYAKLNLANGLLNADFNAGAAVAYSKLNLAGSLVNADFNASAAIAATKLAVGGNDTIVMTRGGTVVSTRFNQGPESFVEPASGDWLGFNDMSSAGGSATGMTLNTLYYVPVWVPTTGTYDMLAFYISGAGTGSNICRVGVYTNSTRGTPSALVSEFGTVFTNTIGAKTVSGSASLTANNLYWMAIVSQNNTACTAVQLNYTTANTGNNVAQIANPVDRTSTTGPTYFYTQTGVTGNLPANTSGLVSGTMQTSLRPPTIVLRKG